MIMVEPKKRVTDQKTADFMASVVENVTVPLRLHALARIGMFEQMGAIEVRQAMLVARENATAPNPE